MKYLIVLLIPIIFASCIPNEPDFKGFTRTELQQLLSGGNEKKWSLTERIEGDEVVELSNCVPQRHLLFNYTSDTKLKDSLFYIRPYVDCEEKDTLKGFWYIPEPLDDFVATDTLTFVWEESDTAFFTLDNITPLSFQLSTLGSANLIEVFELYLEEESE